MKYTGKSYSDFLLRTPFEFALEMRGHLERLKDEQRARMSAAYANGVLVHIAMNNPKKFPKAEEFLREKTRRVVTSLDDQRAILAALAKGSG